MRTEQRHGTLCRLRRGGPSSALSLLLAVVVTASGCSWVDQPSVSVIGDSITQQSAEDIRSALDGSYDVTVKAQAGKTIEQMSPFVKQAVEEDPDAIIVNLGTNDTNGGTDYLSDMQTLLELLRPIGCVVMVTVNDISGLNPDQAAIADRINAAIEGSGYRVWDWNTRAKEHPEWITGDAIHPSTRGREAIARWYEEELDSCDL